MKKLDVLNRDKFVDNLLRVMGNISDNKVSTCLALNGIWGSGKSFVLDTLMEIAKQSKGIAEPAKFLAEKSAEKSAESSEV